MGYGALLAFHSVWRWVVVIAVAARLGRAVAQRGAPFTSTDRWLGIGAMIALDVQLLLGFGLYLGVSPATRAAFADVGAAMKDPVLRFWLVEHTSMMLAAVVLGHVANIRVKRASSDAARHTTALVFFGAAVLCILLGMPWPFRPGIGRALFPGL